jgi:DNA polymerase-1
VGKVDVDSYRTAKQSACQVNPIPDGVVSIYVTDNGERAFVGWGADFKAISLRQVPELLRPVLEGLLKDPQTKIITNNGKAVAKVLRKYGLLHCEIIDVVIAEKLIANGEVAYRCLDLKSVFKRHGLSENLERSSVVHRLAEVWGKQAELIDAGGLGAVLGLESKVIWVTGKIESAGIEIDVDALVRRHDELTERLDSLVLLLRESIPDDISLNDRIKVKEYLNSEYALSLAKIDEEAVGFISDAAVANLIRPLLDYWKTSRKRRQIELYMSLTGPDDRVRDSIDQVNTKTGRFYRQLQTVEKGGAMRTLFKAKAGYKYIVADYSQQEARIIAGLSDDQGAIDLFNAGKDIYLETAKLLLGDRVDGAAYRALGKEIVLGLNNGRSAFSIYESLARMGFGYDLDDVMGMIMRYDMEFPGIRAWRDEVVKSARDNGVIATGLGRTLKVSDDANENSLYNYPVQGTAADGFKRALLELDEQLAGLDVRIVHILHDEVIVEVRDDIVDGVAGIVKKCMEEAFKETLPDVPFSVEPQVKKRWGSEWTEELQ